MTGWKPALNARSRPSSLDGSKGPLIENRWTPPTAYRAARTLTRLDAQDLDARLGAWMTTRVGRVGDWRVIAVVGESMRGAAIDGSRPHLLAALDHDHGVVVGQRAVPDKGSEISELKDILEPMDLTDTVVTADALHCQPDPDL